MDTKQKARAYDEALERAKRILEIGVKDTRDKKIILSFFPELKEINEEEIKKAMINFFKSERKEGDTVLHYGVNIESMIAWLEKQGEQKTWSEEDEKNLQGIIDEIQANKNKAPDYDLATYDRFLSWLKSISPQNRWKPSDEQMEALWNTLHPDDPYYVDLSSLYNDLKKLKE